MAVFEVAEFMGQHSLHFITVELRQQGVEKHHALGGTKACEEGIRVCRATAAIHYIKTLGGKARAGHQGRHALSECGVFQRCELVEQGHDHIGCNPHHKQLVDHQRCPGVEPPQRATRLHEPQHQPQNGQAQYHAHQ